MKVLLLGETAEAAALARAVHDRSRRSPQGRRLTLVSAVDAARARALGELGPGDLPEDPERRRGGVIGAEGLITALKWERFRALIDASHPFDRATRDAAAAAVRILGLPFLQYHRPLWPTDGPGLSSREDGADAARRASFFSRVFLWVGLERLRPFAERRDLWHLVRAYDPPPGRFPLARGDYAVGRGPFTEAHEAVLLGDYGVTRLILENGGGALGLPMLRAAAAKGLPVDLIAPPPAPEPGPGGARAARFQAALAWLDALI